MGQNLPTYGEVKQELVEDNSDINQKLSELAVIQETLI